MHRLLILAAAGSGFILAAASNAAELISPNPAAVPATSTATSPPSGDPADAARVAGASQVPASGRPILLEAGKGTLIRLPRAASTVFIANPDVADVQIKSPSLIYLNAKTTGETVLYAVDADDHVLLNAPVRVEHDLSRLRDSFQYLIPGENITVESIDGSLVLKGNVSSAGRAERANALANAIASETKGKVINQLSVATPNQVNLRVKIAEVSRTALKVLGFNWNKANGNIQFATPTPNTLSGFTTENAIQFALGAHSTRILATIDALAQENLATDLAEPNLTATSGQPASFLVGGEIPIPISQPGTGGIATITIEYKAFGVRLDFTPTIIDAKHVSLHVKPEVSQLDFANAVTISGFSIPALTVRRAETTVELGSGESFALAGLLQNTSTENISKIPGIGDIPVLGQLFRSQRFQKGETELVIIVTPYLVKPVETALATPTDGFVPPHDLQMIVNGATYRQTLPGPAKGPAGPSPQGLIGPVGFRLD